MADWGIVGAWVAGVIRNAIGHVAGRFIAKYFPLRPAPSDPELLARLDRIEGELRLIRADNRGQATATKREFVQKMADLVAAIERVGASTEATTAVIEAARSAVLVANTYFVAASRPQQEEGSEGGLAQSPP